MTSFEETGLREELIRALDDEDLVATTALQAAVIPALRRGTNVVARASSGSGKTLAYGLGVLDRMSPANEEDESDSALRVLILTPTIGDAELVAQSLVPFAQALDLQVTVPGAGWGTSTSDAPIVVSAPGEITAAVQQSQIKLDALEAVVVDGASSIAELGDWARIDAILDLVPRDAQRVVFSASLPPVVEDLIARRVKRALRYPAGPAVAQSSEKAAPLEGRIGYVLASEREKFALLTGQLQGREPGTAPPILFCRTDERAAELAERLSLRGFLVGQPDEADVDIAIVDSGTTRAELIDDAGAGDVLGQTISYDVPADAAELRNRHLGDPDAIVLLEPRELPHLLEIAGLAMIEARSTPISPVLGESAKGLERFRSELRAAIKQEDTAAQMLVLEPLFEEFNAAEVAAAATALLRRRREAESKAAPAAPSAAARPSEPKGAPAGPAPVTWTRLFVSVGNKDDIRPGDLVGALAGEAGIPGSQIGKIEIRDSFSVVDVQADIAEKVIRAVNGTTLKGRSVRVDFDRGGPERRASTRGGPPQRRSTRPPPRDGR